MPFSTSIFDEIVKTTIKHLSPKRCLDIGAGAGKYGKIIRTIIPDSHIIAIEIEPSYISEYNLRHIYNEVKLMDALNLIYEKIDEQYDLVILGDILEHLKKSAGVDLINFLVYRTKYILVNYPFRYLQNDVDGYKHEAHISVWHENDFTAFNHISLVKDNQHLVFIEGYLSNENDIKRFKEIFNSS